MNATALNIRALRQALNLRDLTDPEDGRHAMQILIEDILCALRREWGCQIKIHRESPIISIEDNYNKLRYPPDGAARDARYTRMSQQAPYYVRWRLRWCRGHCGR